MKTPWVYGIITRMKKVICIVLIFVLIFAVCAVSFGCKGKIKAGDDYRLYQYDARTDKFVRMGATLKFGKGFSTFEYTFGDGDLTIYGGVEQTKDPDTFIISCGEEAVALVTERYRQSMVEGGATQNQLDAFDAISATLTPKSQYFYYDGRLFTGDAVEMFRVAEDNSDAFEGLYRMDSSSDIVRVRGGFIYAEDDNGEYAKKTGRYTISRGMMTIVSLDDEGKDRYQNGVLMRKRYFMAKITLPSDGTLLGTTMEEQMKSSAFVSKINTDISDYSGKTIAVLCDSFLSNGLK